MNDMGYSFPFFQDAALDNDQTFRFNEATMGICRDEISDLTNENVNLNFNQLKQDACIEFGRNGIVISSVNISPGANTLGTVNYATQRICRTIPTSVLRRQMAQGDYELQDLVNTRFRARLITKAQGRKIIITLQRSKDCGRTYTDITPAAFGNDPQGNPYIIPFTAPDGVAYTSVIWVSDRATLNDVNASGQNQSKQNVLQTRKAPFHPTINLTDENILMSYKDFDDPDLFFRVTPGNTGLAFVDYNDTVNNGNNYSFEITDVADGNKVYYAVADVIRNPTTFTDINLFHISETDTDYAGATLGTMTYAIATNTGAIVRPAAAGTITFELNAGASTGIPIYISLRNQHYNTIQICNPVSRPITNMRVFNTNRSPKNKFQMHRDLFAGEDRIHDPEPANLGADVQRPVSLLVKMLNNEDIINNTGAPLYLTNSANIRLTGTIGGIIGSNENAILAPAAAFPMPVFTSDALCHKISKDSIINVSINEFSGLKSFNGIDQSVGKNLSGEGKVLAVLPREEFSTANIEKEGSLVYVAPFENWLDINNGQELTLNQLTVEVRTPAGGMATDLRPDTICQIKIREDPAKIQEKISNDNYSRMLKALSSAQTTGQTSLNAFMTNDGS